MALAASVSTAGFLAASTITSLTAVPLSGIPVSIILGLALNNTLNLPKSVSPGLKFTTTTILRAGIICVGAKLSLPDMLKLGVNGVPVVLSCMTAGYLFIPFAAKKANLTPELGTLLATGTSICGVTAITAASPVINATHKDTAVAVANVVAFGTMGMLAYPMIANSLVNSSEGVGMFLGTAIHDTSQVLGAAASYKMLYADDTALQVAACTKLTRNLFLGVAIPGLAYQYRDEVKIESEEKEIEKEKIGTTMSGLATFQKYVPGFVVAFIGVGALRSLGDYTLAQSSADLAFYVLPELNYHQLTNGVGSQASTYLLGTAMAGVGLSTSAESLKGVGYKPFIVGGSGALVVGGTGLACIKVLECFVDKG